MKLGGFKAKIVCFMLIITMVFTQSINVFALDSDGEDSTPAVTSSSESAAPAKAAEPKETPKAETKATEATETQSTEAVAKEEAEAPAEEPAAAEETTAPSTEGTDVTEETEETEESMPAQTFAKTSAKGVKVSVSAPEGAFPEGTTMKVADVSDSKALSLASKASDDVQEAKAVDITFYNDGDEIQPKKDVKVKMSGFSLDGDDFNVYHVSNGGSVEKVSNNASEAAASFSASSFSIYIVTGEGEEATPAIATYIFMDGETVISEQAVKDGEKIYEPEAPEKNGSKFLGWYDGENKFDGFGAASVSKNETVTLKAEYQEAGYVYFLDRDMQTVAYTKDGTPGTTVSTSGVTLGSLAATETVTGWYTDAALTHKVTEVEIPDDGIKLYPKVETGHWLVFDSVGGTYIEPVFYTADKATVAPAMPTKLGYTFNGWMNGSTKFNFGQTLTEDVNLTASWTAGQTKYTVMYWLENANDDEYSYGDSVQRTGETGTIATFDVKDFEGFSYDTSKTADVTIAGDGSTIVNLYYSRIQYTVVWGAKLTCKTEEHTHGGRCYNLWGKLTCKKTEHTHGVDCYQATEAVTAKWGSYIGDQWPGGMWTVSQSRDSAYQAWLEMMPIGGKTFYKQVTGRKSFTATYYVEDLNGNYVVHHQDTCTYDENLTVTDDDRYALTGFTYDHGTKNRENYNGATFYYTRNSYDINFYNGDAIDKTVSKKYEASIEAANYTPARPENIPAGYEFKGWYDNEACEGTAYNFSGKTMPAHNITLYAKWEAPTYEATAHVKAGDKTIEVKYGETIDSSSLPAVVTPEGERFVGWVTTEGDPSTIFNFNTKIYSNVDLYPYFVSTTTPYSVTYVDSVSTAPTDDSKYLKNSYAEIVSPTATKSADKVFVGWESNGKVYQPGDKIKIEGNVTLTAVWGDVPGTVSVTYDPNGGVGEAYTVSGLAYNAKVDYMSAGELGFSKFGYKFAGWGLTAGATEDIYGFLNLNSVRADNGTGSNVLYAIWEKDEEQVQDTIYTVKHVVDGTEITTDTKSYTSTAWIAETNPTIKIESGSLKTNTYIGYKYDRIDPTTAVEGGSVASGTTITLYYVKDPSQTKETFYTVKHLVDGTEQTADTKDYKGTAWIHEEHATLAVQEGSLAPNTYKGYKYDSIDPAGIKVGDEVETGSVIKLNYVKDDSQTQPTKYTVHYTIEGTEQTADQVVVNSTAWINDNPAQIAIAKGGIATPADKYKGYKLDPANPEYPAEGTMVNSGTEYTVNYVKDPSQTKETVYTVKHVVGGTEKTADTKEYKGTAWVNETNPTIVVEDGSVTPNTYTGYKYVSTTPAVAAGDSVASGTTITLTYVKDDEQTKTLKYTVQHEVAGTVKDAQDYTETVWVNEDDNLAVQAGSIDKKTYTGYKYDSIDPAGTKVGDEVATGSVITLKYVKDPSQTQATSYTVHYTIEGTEQTADKVVETSTAWINDDPAQIAIAKGGIATPADKYTGYKLDPKNPTYPTEGTKVNSGTEYTVNYVKDPSQTQPTSYTVHYTIEGTEQAADKVVEESTAWINDDPAQIAIAKGGIATPADKYTGYKLDPANPEYPAEGTKVNSGTEYTVNYVKDPSQTKETVYTVKHIVDGTEKTADTKEYKGTAWINETNPTIVVKDGSVAPNTYKGYKYVSTTPAVAAGDSVASGTTITLTYVKDDEQTKTLKYTVQHEVAGTVKDAQDYTETVWVNEDDNLAVQAGSIDKKTYTGYKYDSIDPAGTKVGDEVATGSVITLKYVKDPSQTQPTSYTVHYTIQGTEQTADKVVVNSTAWINDNPAQIAIAKGGIATPADKYTGYKLDPKNPSYPAEDTMVNSGTEYTVNYIADFSDVAAEGVSKQYDGEASSVTVTGTMDGDQIAYFVGEKEVTNSFTNVDESTSVVVKVTRGTETIELPVEVSITPVPITITADFASKIYGDADPEFTGNITSGKLVKDDDLGAITYKRTNTDEAEGTYENVIVPVYTANSNYEVEEVPNTFVIENERERYNTVVVTYKVVNGSWDEETGMFSLMSNGGKEDRTASYTVKKKETITLDPPAVGNSPDEGYQAGSWDVVPTTIQGDSTDVVYTYTYAKKPDPIDPDDNDDDEDTDEDKSPKTGDETPIGLMGMLMILSTVVAGATLFRRKEEQ